jgi:hypothetical protein
MSIGKIIHWTGRFKINWSQERRERNFPAPNPDFFDFNPNLPAHKLLEFGDSIKVPRGVMVTVQCLPGNDPRNRHQVTDTPNWVVSHWCSSNISMRAEHFTATQLRTPKKLGEIAEYPRGKKFQIKRHSWAGFKDYHSTWGTGLYEGDQLKVPPGVTVKVKFENNQGVQVTDNNQPWDLLDNWQNQ